ncbi:VOC family protein [Rhodoglobus aureus]|uniref:VOC domain-containing protein n=1 Tax=Rhodoglobus aureus TaxID=191497 RepID=A0ABP4G208_9MICO
MRLSSAIIFVSDLDRSIAFYCDLLQLTCSIRDGSAALLVGPENYELYLRGKGAQASHAVGSIGIQYLMWSTDSVEDLQRCEEALRRESPQVRREHLDGFDAVEGLSPDHMPIVIVYPGPDQVTRHKIIPRIYRW